MKSGTLSYITRHIPTNERIVNRLFVSAFIGLNGWQHPKSSFLSGFIITEDDMDYAFLQNVKKRICTEFREDTSLESLVRLFELVISPADRIVTGAIYTPKNVRKTIIKNTIGNKGTEALKRLRVADISCGCGGFLMDTALWIHQKTGKSYKDIYRDNIFGIDVQEYAIERTKLLLCLLALSEGEDADFEFNLLCRDTLDYVKSDWDTHYMEFDAIVGNPPYVCSRNLSLETRTKFKEYDVCTSGHPDLYIPFFWIAIDMLSDEGCMGYITMNTFLRSVNGRAIRDYFSQNQYKIYIVDFRGFQIFESKNTYTCLFYLDKQHTSESIYYAVDENGVLPNNVRFKAIAYENLDNSKGWALNNFEVTTAIETIGIQIKDYCPSRHGIATLSNDTYIFNPVAEDEKYFYLKSEKRFYPIERGICRDILNPNKLNSVDDINSIIEKVIFPYEIIGGRASVYEPKVMKNHFPKAFAYLKAKRPILLRRDKGNTSNYPQWYAYGRTQSLVMPRYKLFFPKYANKSLLCAICDAPNLMSYNGLAFVNSDVRKLRIIKAIIESNLFWEYIKANGKPYSSGYFSLTGVDIKHFGIPELSVDEEIELLAIDNKDEIEQWLRIHYNNKVANKK